MTNTRVCRRGCALSPRTKKFDNREEQRSVDGIRTYIIARRTSPMGITPSFSPLLGSAKSANASLISASSCAVMSCSLASLDCRAAGVGFAPEADEAAAPPLRRGGYITWSVLDKSIVAWLRKCQRRQVPWLLTTTTYHREMERSGVSQTSVMSKGGDTAALGT